jgi:CENP-B N-terminal DNA-binding domain.
MLMIREMEDGEKRANVCSSLGLAPATVSTIMVNAENIKQSGTENYKIARIRYQLHWKF